MAMDVGAPKGKKGQATPDMNVTPLVDVVLVLLIIFMVVTPMMNAHFWINLPRKTQQQAEEPPPPDEQDLPVIVSVTPEGWIRINRDLVSDEEFPVRLHRVLAARADRKIFFDASDQAPYARAVQVLDLARGGGAAHIAVMTEALE